MEAVGLADERLPDRVVVAATAGEARGVPGVVDLHLLGGKPDDAELGLVVGAGHWRAVREEDAAADETIGVQAAAAELPATADPEAAVDPMGLADRRQPPRREQVHVGIELACHRLLDARCVVAAVGADHRHPRRRRIVVGEELHQLALLQNVHLWSAPGAWKRNAEDACAPHRFDQVGRQAPVASDVVGGRFDRRTQRAGAREDGFAIDDGRRAGRHESLRVRLFYRARAGACEPARHFGRDAPSGEAGPEDRVGSGLSVQGPTRTTSKLIGYGVAASRAALPTRSLRILCDHCRYRSFGSPGNAHS